MRQLQKIFITMALLTSGAANADCSSLVGDYSCVSPGANAMDMSIAQSVDDQGGTHHIFNLDSEGITLTADGTDHIYTGPTSNYNYNISCQNDEFVMSTSAFFGTDLQTWRLSVSEESEDVLLLSITKLDESGAEQTMSSPVCERK